MSRKKKKEYPDFFDIFNLKILGMDFGELIRSWTGVEDLWSLVEKPELIEEVKKRLEERRARFQEAQEQLRKKYGDAVRFDYDIRIGGLLGDREEVRIGGGKFFERLDELARERTEWARRKEALRTPVKRVKIPKEEGLREPLVDILDEKDYLEVVAEMPGVEEKDIKLSIAEDKISISADAKNRKYRAEVALPAKVSPSPIEQWYKSGIFGVKLKKEKM